MNESLIDQFKGKNLIAVLIDPEKCQQKETLIALVEKINVSGAHFIFVGGSTVNAREFEFTISVLRTFAKVPLVIFPGSSTQVSSLADGILFLSLLSGRNPDFLIGHHVQAAESIVESGLEVIPTAYLLIDGGSRSSVAYVSQTTPIPRDKVSIVKSTALAGKLQGKQLVFLDAGSGAKHPVPAKVVESISKIGLPIIVGGGIRTIEKVASLHQSGANIVVIGNKIESDIDFLLDVKNYISQTSSIIQ